MNKRVISLLAILSLIGGVAFAYDTDGNPANKREIAGTPGYQPYREYQEVRYGADGANDVGLSAGDVVIGDCISQDGITVGLVGTVGSSDAVRGVVVSPTIPTCDVLGSTASTDFGRRNWGWIQVRGLCTKVNVLSGGAAGSTLVASPSARYAGPAPSAGTATRALGFAYAASGSGNSNKVDVNI